jgi:predicted enzyme related to lactoylglutathione lyase
MSMKPLKLMAFCATTMPKAARGFYEDVVGATFVEDTPFALVFDVGGVMLRVQKVDKLVPHAFTQLGFEVDDARAAVVEFTARGAVFEQFGLLGQTADGVWAAPGGALIAWFKDPDGNTLSITEMAVDRRD